ncbi:MAG: NAD(P)/FAD-dependent oxidoreductase [Actinomycetes bacterium]
MIDLLVAGGGPVGLAVAIRARLAGWEVTVVEPRESPVDKACGEGLMPAGVRSVRSLGVDPPGWPFAGIGYLSGSRRVEARFRNGPGLGVRRTVLQEALATRATEVGVERVVGRVEEFSQDDDHVEAASLRARWLVAADGLHSTVRRQLGLDRPVRASPVLGAPRYGLRQHFRIDPWSEVVEVHWSATAEAYVTPVGADLVGVALLGPAGPTFDETLAQFPTLADRLAGVPRATPVRGAGPLRQRAGAPVSGRVLLAGDAAGYVDARTGEGLATGLATAEAAVAALRAGRPEAYAASWRAATRRYRWLTSSLLAVASRPALRQGIVPAAARAPWLFGRAVDALG